MKWIYIDFLLVNGGAVTQKVICSTHKNVSFRIGSIIDYGSSYWALKSVTMCAPKSQFIRAAPSQWLEDTRLLWQRTLARTPNRLSRNFPELHCSLKHSFLSALSLSQVADLNHGLTMLLTFFVSLPFSLIDIYFSQLLDGCLSWYVLLRRPRLT